MACQIVAYVQRSTTPNLWNKILYRTFQNGTPQVDSPENWLLGVTAAQRLIQLPTIDIRRNRLVAQHTCGKVWSMVKKMKGPPFQRTTDQDAQKWATRGFHSSLLSFLFGGGSINDTEERSLIKSANEICIRLSKYVAGKFKKSSQEISSSTLYYRSCAIGATELLLDQNVPAHCCCLGRFAATQPSLSVALSCRHFRSNCRSGSKTD